MAVFRGARFDASIRFFGTILAGMIAIAGAAGCENSAPREERMSSTQPQPSAMDGDSRTKGAAPSSAERLSQAGAEAGEEARRAGAREAGRRADPEGEPADDEPPVTTRPGRPEPPRIPDYVNVLEKIEAAAPVAVIATTGDRYRLTVETRNVQKMRFDREQLDFAAGRSLALLLDNQAFEVQADTVAVEFERSRNGEWVAVTVKKEP